ncbi:unnamed protein product [Leptosia nina]|uniref:Methionine synthase reductase n=1 Tax=Leptosia nina TaxID=320188 RepID=A0AAV1K496_9NEOP
MVLRNSYQNLMEETLKNPPGTLTLPSCKPSFLKLEYSENNNSSDVHTKTPSILPFACSEEFAAHIKSWRRLSAPESPYKPIYEIDFDIKGSHFSFKPGDTIGLTPQNNEFEVESVINHLDLQSLVNCKYYLSIKEGLKGKVPGHIPLNSSIKYVLTHCVDLRGVIKKLFILTLSQYTAEDSERNILKYLCSKEGSAIYTSHVLYKNMSIVDLFNTFTSCKPPIEVLFEHLPRLLPRPYSIVNSHNVEPDIIRICFSVINIESNKKGLTTGWLEKLLLNDTIEDKLNNLKLNGTSETPRIPIFLRQNVNNFTLPYDLKIPIIMIGVGSGISPYIGFLQERGYLKQNLNLDIGFSWLFVGCRNPALDFIYDKELGEFLKDGVLSKLSTAFSKSDVTEHKYVQDAIIQDGAEVAKLIKEGATVYICGDVKTMVATVKDTLVKCVAKYHSITEQNAENLLSDMQKGKRLLVDLWT